MRYYPEAGSYGYLKPDYDRHVKAAKCLGETMSNRLLLRAGSLT